MPVAAFAPSRLHTDYAEWTVPGIAHNGKVWAWNNTSGKYEPTALSFDPAGTAAAAVAAHVAAANPHSQYLLASGVSAFGASLIDDADAAAARTTLGLGTAATLNVGTGANNVVQLNGSAQLPAVSGALLTNLPVGSAAGSNTQVQYNAAGMFAGDAGMTYDAANDRLTVAGGLVAPSMRPASDSTTALQWQNAAGTAVLTVDTTTPEFVVSANAAVKNGVTSQLLFRTSAANAGIHKIGFSFHTLNSYPVAIVGSATTAYGRGTLEFWVNGTNIDGVSATAADAVMRFTATNIQALKPIQYLQQFFTVGNNQTLDAYNGYRISNNATQQEVKIGIVSKSSFSYARGDLRFVVRAINDSASFDPETDTKMMITTAGLVAVGQTAATALLDLAASTTSHASLRIRHGTAPTSGINDGDVWTTTAGLFARINGVTYSVNLTAV